MLERCPSRGVRITVFADTQRKAKTAEAQQRYCSTVVPFSLEGTMVSSFPQATSIFATAEGTEYDHYAFNETIRQE